MNVTALFLFRKCPTQALKQTGLLLQSKGKIILRQRQAERGGTVWDVLFVDNFF